MGKDQIVTEEHHRRPRSLDGTESPANKSYVISRLHKRHGMYCLVTKMHTKFVNGLISALISQKM